MPWKCSPPAKFCILYIPPPFILLGKSSSLNQWNLMDRCFPSCDRSRLSISSSTFPLLLSVEMLCLLCFHDNLPMLQLGIPGFSFGWEQIDLHRFKTSRGNLIGMICYSSANPGRTTTKQGREAVHRETFSHQQYSFFLAGKMKPTYFICICAVTDYLWRQAV